MSRRAFLLVLATLLAAPATSPAQTERVRVQWTDPDPMNPSGLVISVYDDQGRTLHKPSIPCQPGSACTGPIPSAAWEQLTPTSARVLVDAPTDRRLYVGLCPGITPVSGQVTLTDPDGTPRAIPFDLGVWEEFVAGSTPAGGNQLVAVPPGPGCGFAFQPLLPSSSAPIARPDAWMVLAGDVLEVPPAGVLVNDSDLDGGPLTAKVISISFASSEWSGLAADGSFTYRAGPGTRRRLEKTITYVAVDPQGNESAPTTAVVTVLPKICGRAQDGGELIEGSAAADRLIGTGARDEIRASGGADRVDAGAGNDCVFGDDGDDALRGGPDDDGVNGGAGHDRMDGGRGIDSVDGGPGNDLVIGGDGNDRVFGGDGHDVLSDGLGVNAFFGGAGDDMVSARRGDVAERIDCGPGKDIAIVDHADLVTNCETVERPLSGRRRLGGKAAVARTAITWPRIVGRWAKASSDYEYWAWYDHPQLKHDPLTCWTGAREFQPSIVAAVSGIDPGSLLHSLRYAKIQFRWSAIDPNEGSARSQIAKRSPRTFRTTSRYDNWWEAKHPRISIGQGLSNTLGVAFVQYRVSWHTDSVVDRRIARTRWYTLGVCHYTSFTGA